MDRHVTIKMSRISIKSKESDGRLLRRKKKVMETMKILKPINFCCTMEDIDSMFKYDQRKPPYTSSLTAISLLQESPAIKLRTQYVNRLNALSRRSTMRGKDIQFARMKSENLGISSIIGSNQWYIEDEIALAKDILWEDRLRKSDEETRRNVRIGKEKMENKLKQIKNVAGPRWYQDFSIDQMKNLMILEDMIMADYKQMETVRTKKTLMDIGVLSTFFQMDAKNIRKMQRLCDFKAIDFLREIYRLLTGNYFEEEGYKNNYDCNERIILSAIAFLSLPETIIELNKRLPSVIMPKIPSKPLPMKVLPRKKASSPYKEELFTRPDWVTYLNRLESWRKYCKSIAMPKVTLPDPSCPIFTYKEELRNVEINHKIIKNDLLKNNSKKEGSAKREDRVMELNENMKIRESIKKRLSVDKSDIFKSPEENQVFDFTFSGLSENQTDPVQYKICGTLNPPRENKKSWLGEKDAHFIISGVSNEPPQCPVSFEMTGVANVTPINSDERFFTVLKLGDGPNKIYPSGRKNLSKNWQEWLHNADEEFIKVEKEANKILKNVEATMRLVFPGPICDSCCSCRQTRKTNIISKKTKAPYMVIDTLTEDDRKQKYIVGSMALHSPALTPDQSTVNLIDVIASEDKITTNVIINGVTTAKGEKKYYITGMAKDTIHIPSKKVESSPPLLIKNIPPCTCAIQQMFNQNVTPRLSTDNIPWTKKEGLCLGKKYRPETISAYSCKVYPGDKSCRLNPFLKEVARLERKKNKKEKSEDDYYTKEKRRMYSIADFQPCGDEHGMHTCDGPWGTLNILTPDELKEQEKERKEILRGPPCGIKPGRAVCEGPFGERIPHPKRSRPTDDEEEIEEEEEEGEEEKREIKKPVPMKKEKILRRDKLCHASPETIAAEKKTVEKKVTKFIPDPDYHGYDDPWNVSRTAPSIKETITEYEQTLKLSTPKPRSDPSEPIIEVLKKKKSKKSEILKSSKDDSLKTLSDKHKVLSTKIHLDEIKNETKSKKKPVISIKERLDVIETSKKNLRRRMSSLPFKRKRTNSFSKRGFLQKDKIKRTDDTHKSKQDTKSIVKMKEKNERSPQMTKKFIKNDGEKRKFKNKLKSYPNNSMIECKKSFKNNPRSSYEQKLEKGGKKQNKRNTNESMIRKISRDHPAIDLKNKSISNSQEFTKFSEKKSKKKKSLTKEVGVALTSEYLDKEMKRLKSMMVSPDIHLNDVQPIILPEEPASYCQHEYGDTLQKDSTFDETISKVKISKKGPCGWRTKSEQELPVKKTLAYLTDPDPPIEMVPVRPGGKACICRENRNKKKILMYQIGGSVGNKKIELNKVGRTSVGRVSMKKKEKEEEHDETRVIEGVIYYTPPPSRRRSDEYVPEYDVYESPYEICAYRPKNSFMNMLERYMTPPGIISKTRNNIKPCDCNDYLDIYGVAGEHAEIEESKRLLEEREKLMESKSPKERWALALKDNGLMDYYAGCKHKVPCWSTCARLNKYACPPKPPRLKIKKPVCECKYERKIVENKEEKIKWKERQNKLRNFKKKAYTNVKNISRPMKADTKMIISDVKRIPREDEYIDDVQYCISGIIENYTMDPKATTVVEGLNMATPIHTPKPSKEDIPCVCLHSHWSPTNIPPGPLPRKDETLIEERKRRDKYLEEAARIIYGPNDEENKSEKCYRDCKTNYIDKRKKDDKDENINEKNENDLINPIKHNICKSKDEQKNFNRNTKIVKKIKEQSGKIENHNQGRTTMTEKKVQKETDKNKKLSMTKTITESKVDKDQGDKNLYQDNVDLGDLIKKELKSMATEGFLFAKLPKCHRMPQIQNWIMYRKGFVFTDKEKEELMTLTFMVWAMADVIKQPDIMVPSLDMSKKEIRELTFDRVEEMKKKIAMKNAIFYSRLRKMRVLYSQYMWSTMEFRKHPSLSFKRAYFTYMASKEADGHVFKPWMINEVREKD